MKKLSTLSGFILLCSVLFAQAPESFKYQAVLRDGSGNVKVGTATIIQLFILQSTANGSSVYSETHAVSTNEFGLVNLTVGSGTAKSGNLALVDWSLGPYFLKVRIDGTDFGTSQLLSVPFALYAKTASNGFSGNYDDLANKPILFDTKWSSLTLKPTTLAGYGITDAFSGSYTDLSNKPVLFDSKWSSLTLTPTTIAGYGITDAFTGNYTDLSNKPSVLNATLFSTATGLDALKSNTGLNNSAFGYYSLYSNTTGTNNTATGYLALDSNTTGRHNIAIGASALRSSTTADFNTAIGSSSLVLNTTGWANTAIGYFTLLNNTTGLNNTATGFQALMGNTTGSSNTANGHVSLYRNTTGQANTATGAGALQENTTGNYNAASGSGSLSSNTTGNANAALGFQTLRTNTIGVANTAIGYLALRIATTGNYNTALGSNSGLSVTTGANLTLLGSGAEPSLPTATDEITLGNSAVTSLRCNVQSLTSLSDARDKKNIQDLSVGLDFIMALKPRQFNWDKREWYVNNQADGSKMLAVPTAGFISQELDATQNLAGAEWLNLVLKNNPEKLEATYGNLLPIMVKAIQEQQVQIEALKRENEILKSNQDGRLQKLEALFEVMARK